MKTRKCDFCKINIPDEKGVSIGKNDLCDICIKKILKATCKKCGGRGFIQERDDEATSSMATCGENRTQYRTVKCKKCQ